VRGGSHKQHLRKKKASQGKNLPGCGLCTDIRNISEKNSPLEGTNYNRKKFGRKESPGDGVLKKGKLKSGGSQIPSGTSSPQSTEKKKNIGAKARRLAVKKREKVPQTNALPCCAGKSVSAFKGRRRSFWEGSKIHRLGLGRVKKVCLGLEKNLQQSYQKGFRGLNGDGKLKNTGGTARNGVTEGRKWPLLEVRKG